MNFARRIDVQEYLNEHPFSKYQWVIFILCFLIVLLDGFDTAAIGFVAPSLIKEWGATRPALAPVLSAALFGLAAGAFAAGPLSDRVGRKRVLLVSVAIFGVACLASSLTKNLEQLTIVRFITGLGLGAAMPNAVTLMSEYCPDQHRATLTNTMFCGFPLGAALGGFLAAWMIPQWGWQSVFILGGSGPLILAVLMILLLPESVRFMVARGRPAAQMREVLRRIGGHVDSDSVVVMSEPGAVPVDKSGAGVVASRPYLVGSAMLFIAYFMGLVIFYGMINWMPVLLKDVGLEPRTAALVSALFPLGGIGAILFGWLMDRLNANWVVAAGFALTAVFIYAIGQVGNAVAPLMAVVFLGGTLMNMAQSSLPALAAAFYPTSGRATGVAWMMGIGRFGGIAGSFIIAEMTRRSLSFSEIFAVMAVPGLIAAGAISIKQWFRPARVDPPVSLVASEALKH